MLVKWALDWDQYNTTCINGLCHPGGHCWHCCLGALSSCLSYCNLVGDWVANNEIICFPFFKWIAWIERNGKVPALKFHQWPSGYMPHWFSSIASSLQPFLPGHVSLKGYVTMTWISHLAEASEGTLCSNSVPYISFESEFGIWYILTAKACSEF